MSLTAQLSDSTVSSLPLMFAQADTSMPAPRECIALTSATLPYTVRLASQGFEDTVRSDRALASGVNVYRGQITYPAVAETYGIEYTPLPNLL